MQFNHVLDFTSKRAAVFGNDKHFLDVSSQIKSQPDSTSYRKRFGFLNKILFVPLKINKIANK